MKVKELLYCRFEKEINSDREFQLLPNELKNLKDDLLKSDEFKDVTELIILDKPANTNTYKLKDDFKLKNKVSLYGIYLSPPLFDPYFMKPVKNGASITPMITDPFTFIQQKRIVINWAMEDSDSREYLHKLVDEILDNPKEYEVKGERSVLIRGILNEKN